MLTRPAVCVSPSIPTLNGIHGRSFTERQLALQDLFGPYFLKDVDLDFAKRNWIAWDEAGQTVQAAGVPASGDGDGIQFASFTRSDDAQAYERRSAQIDSFLKVCLLHGHLDLHDWAFIQHDAPRRAVGDGAYLEQRYRAFEQIFHEFRTLRSSKPSSSAPFGAFYRNNYERCLEEVSARQDQWQTTLEAWRAVADVLFPAQGAETAGASASTSRLLGRERNSIRIWQPFFSDGACASHLEELGFEKENIHHCEGENFFNVEIAPAGDKGHGTAKPKPFDLIWDNPPWTSLKMKRRILKKLLQFDKPFCVLVPTNFLQGSLLREFVGVDDVIGELKVSSSVADGCKGVTERVGNATAPRSERSRWQIILPTKVWALPVGRVETETLAPPRKPIGCKNLAWLCYKMNLDRDLYLI